MTAMPPAIFLSFFLYQLRAFVNAGFTTVVVISGHSGGNQEDLRHAANLFMKYVPIKVWVRSDPELVEGLYTGDHAGKYELSQLMYIRPDLIHMEARSYEETPESGGRLALGSDAEEASPELGKEIMEACLDYLCSEVSRLKQEETPIITRKVSISIIETACSEMLQSASQWVTAKPWPGQKVVSQNSQWKPLEYYWTNNESIQ